MNKTRIAIYLLTAAIIGGAAMCVVLENMGKLDATQKALYSLVPGLNDFRNNVVKSFPYRDKIGHFLLSGLFTVLLNLSANGRKITVFKRKLYLGIPIVTTGAIFEEFSQILFPTRGFDLLDLAAGLLGIYCLGYKAYPWIEGKVLGSLVTKEG